MSAVTFKEAMTEFDARVSALCAIAFACGCRVAVSAPTQRVTVDTTIKDAGDTTFDLAWDFVMLSPGERAPSGWTIYEDHSGVPVGRSACT